jgi:ankyrin repeat protein
MDFSTEVFHGSKDGHIEKVKEFLEKGTNPDIRDIHGNTLLHSAVRNNQVRIVWLLLRKGINVDTQNNLGDTPLHVACKNGCMDALEELYRKGAKMQSKNNEGRTPLSYLSSKQKERFDDFRGRMYCVGKNEYKQKPEGHQRLTSCAYSEIIFST